MPRIFLINVGANMGHQREVRSPVFTQHDHRFEFLTFTDKHCTSVYPKALHRYVRTPATSRTHLDPDWAHLTYGDACGNGRAGALTTVETNDVLLFWALLWRVATPQDDVFSVWNPGWYLVGSLRVADILRVGESVNRLSAADRKRATANEHVWNGRVDADPRRNVHVFLGELKHSRRFDSAIDLGVGDDGGLLRATIRTKAGDALEWDKSPRWNSALRACRAVLDLNDTHQLRRAEVLQDAIARTNHDFDLLCGF